MRALVVTAAAVAVPVLWEAELVGGGKYDQRIDRWTVWVTPLEDELFVREHVDIEYGHDGDGYITRTISNSLGVPARAEGFPWAMVDNGDGTAAIVFTSLPIDDRGAVSVVRAGEGDARSSPRTEPLHFWLPTVLEAGTSFEYEIIGRRPLDAHDITVSLRDVDLSGQFCRLASGGSCEFTRVDHHYELHLSSLAADDALTIGGTVTALTETDDVYPDSTNPTPREPMEALSRWTLAGVLALVGVSVGRGFGIRRVANERERRRLAAMAMPVDEQHPVERPSELPAIEPWMATALWEEQLDLRSVRSWLAQQVAADVLRVEGENSSRLAMGERFDDVNDLGMARELQRLMGPGGIAPMAPNLRIDRMLMIAGHRQREALQSQLWWRRFGPGAGHWFSWQLLAFLIGWAGVMAALVRTGWSLSWPVTFVLLVLVPATGAAAAVIFTAPKPTPIGNEAAAELIRVRAFFHAVTVPDVDQLWHDGQLTEFCVWAVAMGAADRWYDTVKASAIPLDERFALTASLALGRTSGSWILTSA